MFRVRGFTGPELWDLLETKFKINIEKTTKRSATITVHAHITQEDVDALINAIRDINITDQAVEVSTHNQLLGVSGALIEDEEAADSNLY